jgi:tetratricopeptide (TPR) repeat protein
MLSIKNFSLLFVLPLLSQVSISFIPVQAQTRSCQDYQASDRASLQWYPAQPLPQATAIDSTARLMDELSAIAALPNSADPANRYRLFRLLVSYPDARPPEAPYTAEVEQLLKDLPTRQHPQLIAIFDRLATKIETLSDEPNRDILIANLAKYYQQLGQSDRAAALLDRAIQTELQAPANHQRFSVLLRMVLELGHSQTIAAKLPQIETAINETADPLSMLAIAQNYQAVGDAAQVLVWLDHLAQLPDRASIVQTGMVTTYVQLNRLEQAQPYLDKMLEGFVNGDDPEYGRLIAAYEQVNQPAIADQLFAKTWESIQNALNDSETPFLQAYFKAGGSPDRVFQALQQDTVDRQFRHLLTVAGEYRKRNQPQQRTEAIEQFIRATTQLDNSDAVYVLWQTTENGYEPEAKVAMERLIPLNRIDAKGFRLMPLATQFNLLEQIEPLIQRLLTTDPEARIDLLQQLAIAYAQTSKLDRAVAIAERIPRKTPGYSSAIATLAQIAATLHSNGQVTEAESVFARTASIAADIQELDTRATAYGAIAVAQNQIGQMDAAEASRQLAVTWAKVAPNYPNAVLSAVVQQFLNDNQLTPAWATFQAIEPEAFKETNIDNIVITALSVGDLTIAQQAVSLIDQYHPPQSFLFVAPRLVRAYLGRGQTQESILLLDRAAKILIDLSEQERSPDDVEQIVRLYAQTGQIDQAQNLIDHYPNAEQEGYAIRKQQLQTHLDCYRPENTAP